MAEGENNRERKQAQSRQQGILAGYKGGKEMPLLAYAGLLAIYHAGLAAFVVTTPKSRRKAANQMAYQDIFLLGITTYKLSRLISKDRVTSPLRAPFTEYVEPAGTSEVKEKVRGQGLQRALGDLLICPWCMSPWVAAALLFGFVRKPALTRLLSRLFAVVTVADVLQHADQWVKQRS